MGMRVPAEAERAEGHTLCVQTHPSASSHGLCPLQLPDGQGDAAPKPFSAEELLRRRIRASIGAGRFSDSPLPAVKKTAQKEAKNLWGRGQCRGEWTG